jgi:hypothetical protein
VISGVQGTLDRIGQAEVRETAFGHLGILIRLAARHTSSDAGPTPAFRQVRARPVQARFIKLFTGYVAACGGASRYRGTMYNAEMALLVGYVK